MGVGRREITAADDVDERPGGDGGEMLAGDRHVRARDPLVLRGIVNEGGALRAAGTVAAEDIDLPAVGDRPAGTPGRGERRRGRPASRARLVPEDLGPRGEVPGVSADDVQRAAGRRASHVIERHRHGRDR